MTNMPPEHNSAPSTRTQVGIIGAGPAGLLLSHLLHLQGIDSVVLESRDRAYIENRIRAGVLEQGSVDVLTDSGVGARMHREGLLHDGTLLRWAGQTHRIDFKALTGKSVMVYSQHEVVRDLVAARLSAGGELIFNAQAMQVSDLHTAAPAIRYTLNGAPHTLHCDYIAGCDGFHGICRPAIPADTLRIYERVYPFGWLGILADAPPSEHELIYANHARGFALISMRSPSVQRMYLQCAPDEDLAAWSDDRIWSELNARTATADGAFRLHEGPITQKSVTAMRSFIATPMRHQNLFLLGDAAHIVPPTGAKGMNLAIADVRRLAEALDQHYKHHNDTGLDSYSDRALARIWKVQRFSWWMTTMLHRFPNADDFDQHIQNAELDYLRSSEAASRTLAENYVGLPLD
jgi:p-hydroxybenzoate 3-monooxygenase